MRLLLTSSGITNKKVKQFFISQFDQLENKTAGLIAAKGSEEERGYINSSMKELEDLGIKVTEINISKDDIFENYPEFDIYYVCGGNTYYILDRMRTTHVDKILIEAVNKNKFYVGMSAGSILAGPDIEIAGIGKDGDINDIGLHNLGSFHWIPFIIFPHYEKESKEEVIAFKKYRFQEPVIALTDNQALYVTDSETLLIGKKGGLQFCENHKLRDHAN